MEQDAQPLVIGRPDREPAPAITIHTGTGEWSTRIWQDGRVEFAPGVDPGEQGRIFWDCVAEHLVDSWQTAARAAGWMPPGDAP